MDDARTPNEPGTPRAGWRAGARPRKAQRRQQRHAGEEPTVRGEQPARGEPSWTQQPHDEPTRRTQPPQQQPPRQQPLGQQPPRRQQPDQQPGQQAGQQPGRQPNRQPPQQHGQRTERIDPNAARAQPSAGSSPREGRRPDEGTPPWEDAAHRSDAPPRGQTPRDGTEPGDEPPHEERSAAGDGPPPPHKISVARVAAWRARQGVHLFKKATQADGAGESGLSQLTYAYMLSYGSTAALSVALANTLFFAAANAESKEKVFLYLLITIAPFALVAPVVGPLLDRIRHGRRLAMAACCAGQAICAVLIALNFDSWALYPAALGFMVLDKSFTVLKAAVTPRVLPPSITLVTTNARLTTFGLIASGVFGAVAAGLAYIAGSQGALVFCAAIAVADSVLCMRIPSWVEDTKDEVPASLTQTMPVPQLTEGKLAGGKRKGRKPRQSMGRDVVLALWSNATLKLLTGFMVLFGAFVVKAETQGAAFQQMLLLAVVAGAAGAGSFVGNAIGARLPLHKPQQILIVGVCAALASTVVAALLSGVLTAAIVGLVGGTASALVKIVLDAVIQRDLPERSRASAFGRSETVVQLAWVVGGAIGVLLPARFWIGFTVISVLLAIGLTQVLLCRNGRSLVPGLGGNRPVRPDGVDETPLPKRGPGKRTPTRAVPTERL